MSKEVLEISILVDEKFDVSFNLSEGLFGLILKVFGVRG
ncbi:phenylalanyl-tRNA synthetase subunit alpha [Pedobacter lusitanus]|uniref:Phenylalanyl-tRNA synthetase subunit alpha n=1 Tax=Pedobacter lusitanus TaxID=1503925 RepID=A0A0D0FWP6_9SPHI|nr:phenylalanyl-tRNA synthetase subunit alpha [Pedobacter lusitanus]